MASIVKRVIRSPDGTERVRFIAYIARRGYPRLSKTFDRRTAAAQWARRTEVQMEGRTYQSTTSAERVTVRDLLDRYCREILPTKKADDWVISMAKVINRELGSYPIIALQSADIASYRDKRLAMKAVHSNGKRGDEMQLVSLGRKVSSEKVRKELLFLRRVIDQARREWGVHLPAGNPCQLVKLPKPGRPRDRRLLDGEEQRLLDACTMGPPGGKCARTPWLRPAAELAIETAMRRSELVKLKWADVNLIKRVAKLYDTKNGDDREVPLSKRALHVLSVLPRSIDGRVLPISKSALSEAFDRARARAGLEGLCFHDLRHEGTSRLFEKGYNVMEVAAITGHKSLSSLKRYTHLRAEDLAKRMG